MIYFDHNATTPINSQVLDTMLPFLGAYYGNPSSLYRHGRLARSAIDTARQQVAMLVGAQPSQLIFTSGGTEANNLALNSVSSLGKIAISATEHPSVTDKALALQKAGHSLSVIPVDNQGLITPTAIEQLVVKQPKLVSVMLANNETGTIQNINYLSQQLATTTLIHTDAVQALGKLPIDFNQLGVQMMSISSHKIYGPKGCGALIFTKDTPLNPLLLGGGQEQNLRSGTENVAAIVGFGKAAELAYNELVARNKHVLALRSILETHLLALPNVIIFAQHAPRLPNTVQFGITGLDGEMVLMALDQKGIAVSSGSACAGAGSKASTVLTAMGVSTDLAKAAIRISLGANNTESEIFEFIAILKNLASKT